MESIFCGDGDVFRHAYGCLPFSKSKSPELECGDKIVMPLSALDGLMDRKIPYPWLFRIKKYFNPERVSHCGVLEFTAEEGLILVPDWLMRNLNLQEGEVVVVESTHLPAGSYMKLQPHSTRFIQLSDPKAVLESTLSKFSCLNTGDTVMVPYNEEKFYIDILETRPGPAICLIGTDCEADFAAPLDYKEPEKKAKSKDYAPEKVKDNAAIKVEEKFKTFTANAKGRRLDGELVETKFDVTTDSSSEEKGEVAASTKWYSCKKSGKLVLGSNGVEKTQQKSSDDSTDGARLEEKRGNKFEPFTGKKNILGS